MKLTCYLCLSYLIVTGICGGIFAISGFNALYYLCFKMDLAYRSLLAVNGVAALFMIYSAIIFKPFKGLK